VGTAHWTYLNVAFSGATQYTKMAQRIDGSTVRERQGGLSQLAKLGNVERRRARNKSVRSAVKTSLIKAEKLISEKEAEATSAEMVQVLSTLDRAAKKGVIHPNQAARRKSRLMKKLKRSKES
jgi:small subunit ribosomal protein S20